MRSRVTVVCLCVCMCVCYRSNCSSVDPCCPSVVLTESARYFQGFWFVDFAKSALFESYGVIYLFDRHGHISSTVRSLLLSKWWHGNGNLWPHCTDIIVMASLVPRPSPDLSMLHAEREERTWCATSQCTRHQWLSVGAAQPRWLQTWTLFDATHALRGHAQLSSCKVPGTAECQLVTVWFHRLYLNIVQVTYVIDICNHQQFWGRNKNLV